MHPISLSFYTVPELGPLEMIEVAAAHGCQHVGMRLLGGAPDAGGMPLMHDAALRRAVRRRLRDTGLSVLDANTARLTATTDPVSFAPLLAIAAELEARHVLVTADDPDEARLVARLAALCDRAAAAGVDLQLEFVPWMSVPSLAAAARVLRQVARENLGIAIDALHFDRAGCQPAEIADLPPAWFAYVHLCDAPAQWAPDQAAQLHVATKERLPPGQGGLDLLGLLRALPPNIPVALEIPMAGLAARMGASERVAMLVAAAQNVFSEAAQGQERHEQR